MAKTSAGILPFRLQAGVLEVLLIHPGGPFWMRKDLGAWSIAKGEVAAGESPEDAARREFTEETGFVAEGQLLPLEPRRQPSGKTIHVWAVAGDYDPAALCSITFALEWPKGSGRMQDYPEADRAAWFPIDEARRRILKGQIPFLDELEREKREASGERRAART
jgi:predicted NUDIX family NTP pyrophosphohydrolase